MSERFPRVPGCFPPIVHLLPCRAPLPLVAVETRFQTRPAGGAAKKVVGVRVFGSVCLRVLREIKITH